MTAGKMIHETWAIYKAFVYRAPPMTDPNADGWHECVYIGWCKLQDVFRFPDAQRNNLWKDKVKPSDWLTIQITWVGENIAIRKQYNVIVREMKPRPICNERGYSTTNGKLPVMCSNGTTYSSQSEAARLLGLIQGKISLHMSGRLEDVKGLKFWYADTRPTSNEDDDK